MTIESGKQTFLAQTASPHRRGTANALMQLLVLAICGLGSPGALPAEAQDATPNALSEAEKSQGWTLLFDGKTLAGWRSYRQGSTNHWVIEDGCLKNPKGTGRPDTAGGQIVTADEFTDFDFRFEWKIAPRGNSGVIYFVKDRQHAPGQKMYREDDGTGPIGLVYQLLDDTRHPDAKQPSHRAGALYGLIAPNPSKRLKPVGEFNQSRIVVQGKHVEHWLNGARIVEYELDSPSLVKAIAGSKYRELSLSRARSKAPIQLQDHGDEIWFRNLKLRALAPAQ